MNLGISGQALGDVMSFADIVKLGKSCGVTHYEIWACNVGAGNDYAQGNKEELLRVMREEQISVDCVTLGAAFDGSARKDAAVYSRYLCHAVDFAADIGAKVVNHYCFCISMGEQPDFAKMEACWNDAIRRAEEKGVILALENEAHDSTRTPEQMRAILEHFNHPNFKTNYDAVNYFHASCEGFPAAYEILRPYIGYVHLKNACLYRENADQPEAHRGAEMSGHYAPAPIQYAPIPDGAVNIAGLLTRLEEDGLYTGTCTLEPHTTPEFVPDFYRRESKALRKWGFFQTEK